MVGLRGQHRQAGEVGLDALGRVEAPLDVVDHLLLPLERHQADAERQVGGLPVLGDHSLREVGRHRLEQRADGALVGNAGAEEVGQRQRRAELRRVLRLGAAGAGAVAVGLQHLLLEVGHPAKRRRGGEVVASHGHVDLARHAGHALEVVHVLQRRQVLRHEVAHVRDHLGLGVGGPAEHREGQAHREHLLRAGDGAVHGTEAQVARAPGRPPGEAAGAAPGDAGAHPPRSLAHAWKSGRQLGAQRLTPPVEA